MADTNMVVLTGQIATALKVKHLNGDKKIVRFMLAVQKTALVSQLIPVTCWESVAEQAEAMCSRGTRIAVTGALEYKSKKNDDGSYSNFTSVVVYKLFVGASAESGADEEIDLSEEDEINIEDKPFG